MPRMGALIVHGQRHIAAPQFAQPGNMIIGRRNGDDFVIGIQQPADQAGPEIDKIPGGVEGDQNLWSHGDRLARTNEKVSAAWLSISNTAIR